MCLDSGRYTTWLCRTYGMRLFCRWDVPVSIAAVSFVYLWKKIQWIVCIIAILTNNVCDLQSFPILNGRNILSDFFLFLFSPVYSRFFMSALNFVRKQSIFFLSICFHVWCNYLHIFCLRPVHRIYGFICYGWFSFWSTETSIMEVKINMLNIASYFFVFSSMYLLRNV